MRVARIFRGGRGGTVKVQTSFLLENLDGFELHFAHFHGVKRDKKIKSS